ncbi:MAG: hypothetical protein A2Y88_15335 [Chloroflexi bacterium RBG_13_48_10]|nr:MAG: hypothetical protein A2Y88_15335 [Chloroflexi bacterium RBG_13_48_10]
MSASTIPSQEIIDQFVGNAHGNLAVVKELLERYPSMVNANASWTETAIEAAAQTGAEEIVNYLLGHGAEYDICTAAMLGNLDCLEEFLKEDSNLVNARGAHGFPILYFPTIHARTEVAEYLLQQGADPNASAPGGLTALHGAVMFNQTQMAQWLLDHGANPNPQYEGKTPLAMAQGKKQPELVEVLRSSGGIE